MVEYFYEMLLKKVLPLLLFTLFTAQVMAQADIRNFRDEQFSSERVKTAWKKYGDTLKIVLSKQGVAWPTCSVFLRAFKSQNDLELWARNNSSEEYRHIKTYRICAISGSLGPKRQQGDKQVPEGFYFIDDFNPHSEYHLSLEINYPNYSDQAQTKGGRPGGNIFIHGGCLTVGCLPMGDDGISELYTACLGAKLNGQEHIPVHIFPTRMTEKGVSYLKNAYPENSERQQFWATLKSGFDYFEQNHQIPPVLYGADGKYLNQ